jgi:hypothetical protein
MSERRFSSSALQGSFTRRQLWRIVDGAVASAFSAHPEYLTDRGQRMARTAIVKRVVGGIQGHAEQSARDGFGYSPAVSVGEAAPSQASSARSDFTGSGAFRTFAEEGAKPPQHTLAMLGDRP